MKKVLALALAFISAGFCFAQDAVAPHSVPEIVARWGKYRPVFSDWDIQDVYGDFNDPFIIGELKEAFIQDGVNMLNFIRYLVGMPDDVVADPAFNYAAQALSAVSAMNGYHSHTPEYPEGMPKGIFDVAYLAGPKSNLLAKNFKGKAADAMWVWQREFWGESPELGKARQFNLARGVLTLVADADYRNVFDVQHRRNMFRPQNEKVGFGSIDFYDEWDITDEMNAERSLVEQDPAKKDTEGKPAEGKWFGYGYQQFMSMYSVDQGRVSMPKFDYLAWPAKGYMPLEFWREGSPAHAWSVTFNPALYKVDDPSAISVEILGVNLSYKVQIDKKNKLATYAQIGDDDLDAERKLKKFVYTLSATKSWLPSILFFPGEANYPEAKAGDRYQVTIRGLTDTQGKPATISYWMEFFSLPHAAWFADPSQRD